MRARRLPRFMTDKHAACGLWAKARGRGRVGSIGADSWVVGITKSWIVDDGSARGYSLSSYPLELLMGMPHQQRPSSETSDGRTSLVRCPIILQDYISVSDLRDTLQCSAPHTCNVLAYLIYKCTSRHGSAAVLTGLPKADVVFSSHMDCLP